MNTENWKWQKGAKLRKKSGSDWSGKVVGFYVTEYTEHGYCIESEYHENSVQNYPESALELCK